MNKNSHNYIHNDNIIQHQGELVRLIKEQGYLEPLCNGCQIENYEVQGKEIQNLKDSLIQLTKQAEIQQEKVHLDMLHVDSIKAKLGNLAKGFVFIANKYSKISQNIMNFEKGVSYNCDLPNYGYGKLQQLVESINQDKSESNYKQVMKEQEIIKANLINNNTFLVDEDAVEKRKAYLDDVEDYSDKLKLQLEICSFIADKIFCSLDYKTFAVQFKELQKYVLQSDKVKSKTNDLSLEEQLEQVKDQLSKSELQKLSVSYLLYKKDYFFQQIYFNQNNQMERLYINLKQYLHKNNFIIPETVLQVDYISSPQRGRSSPEKQVKQEAQKDTPSQRDAAIIENSKEIIKKLMENNKQLNELAKRVIEENKLLKEENNQYIDKINSISPIVNLPSTHTPSLNTVKNLRYSMTTQVSEFQQVSSFSPNPKIMKSPPSSKQKVVFESIRNSYSKSPMKKSYALENTIQSIDIENSQTLTMMKAKDSELSGQSYFLINLNKQKEELQQEIQKLKQKIERQQTQINGNSLIQPTNSSYFL